MPLKFIPFQDVGWKDVPVPKQKLFYCSTGFGR